MKIFKSMWRIVLILTVVAVTFLSGVYISEYRRNQKENMSTITTIAVVNADNGVMVDGKMINYASRMMGYPDTNFKSSGLLEAREGMASGRYAAYVLIPGSFSAAVESVNGEPQKAQITYEVYQNLREDARIKVVNDIHNFILNLSTNISYLYVEAILKEMHAVQDDSRTIMKNDISEMELITSIEAEALIEEAEYEALKVSDAEIEYLDLMDDYEEMNNATEGIYTTYEENMQEARDEFIAIKEKSEVIGDQAVIVAETFGQVNILEDAEGNSVYAAGIENLFSHTEDFANELKETKHDAKQVMGWSESDGPVPEELEIFSREDIQNAIDTQMGVINELLTALAEEPPDNEESPDNGEPPEDEAPPDNEGGLDNEALTSQLQGMITDLDKIKEMIQNYSLNGIQAVENIPTLPDPLFSNIQQTITEEIEAPIMAECNTEAENVMAAIAAMQTVLEEYLQELNEYDAMSYMEQDKITEYLSSLFTTMEDMQEEIMEHDDAYLEYIDEVTTTTEQNMQSLQESLDAAFATTQNNILVTMAGLQESRTDINAQNVDLLSDIIAKLPYTRLGNLEYTQVYDFIAEPVNFDDQSDAKTISPTTVSIDRQILFYLFIGIMAQIILYVMVQLIHTAINNKKLTGEEEETWQMELK